MAVMTDTLDVDARLSRGSVFAPDDQGYDDARCVWNAMIGRCPKPIVRAGVADVLAAVGVARDHDLVLSVRGGAHNVTGSAIVEDGLMSRCPP